MCGRVKGRTVRGGAGFKIGKSTNIYCFRAKKALYFSGKIQ